MGITISHKFSQTKHNVKDTLDRAEKLANVINKNIDIDIEVRRLDDTTLLIDVEGCETLGFSFKSVKTINEQAEKEGFSYEYAVLTDDGKNQLDEGYNIKEFPQNEKYYCSNFCKTQFAKNIICHKIVADIIRIVASRCIYADVNDEGEYYHSGKLEDATKSIKENGLMIDSLSGNLEGLGYQVIKGGITKIGKTKLKDILS